MEDIPISEMLIRCSVLYTIIKISTIKSNTTCGYFIAKKAIIRLIIYPVQGNYTICSIALNRIYDQPDDGLEKGQNM